MCIDLQMSCRKYAKAQKIFCMGIWYLTIFCSTILEESEEWRTPSQMSDPTYSSIGYEYQDGYSRAVDGDKEYDPNECYDYDDSYQGRLIKIIFSFSVCLFWLADLELIRFDSFCH